MAPPLPPPARARPGRVGAPADRPVPCHGAVLDHPGDSDTAQGAAVGAHATAEGAPHDVDGTVLVLAQHPDRRPAQVRAAGVTAVTGEVRVNDLQLAAAVEDGPAAPAVEELPGGVAVRERHPLHDQDGTGLIVAMRRRPRLSRVTGVQVEDPPDAAAAQRHLAAPVEDDPGAGIADLGGCRHRDGHRTRTAGERDHPARGDSADHGLRGTAGRGAVADHVVGMSGADRRRRWAGHSAGCPWCPRRPAGPGRPGRGRALMRPLAAARPGTLAGSRVR